MTILASSPGEPWAHPPGLQCLVLVILTVWLILNFTLGQPWSYPPKTLGLIVMLGCLSLTIAHLQTYIIHFEILVADSVLVLLVVTMHIHLPSDSNLIGSLLEVLMILVKSHIHIKLKCIMELVVCESGAKNLSKSLDNAISSTTASFLDLWCRLPRNCPLYVCITDLVV